jgi:hypothetical protein
MTDSVQTVFLESIVMTLFAIAAVVGFQVERVDRGSSTGGPWSLGCRSRVHAGQLEVPVWWSAFCLAYDLGAAGCLAWLIKRHPGVP